MSDDELIVEIQRQYKELGGDVEAIRLPLQKLKEKNMVRV